MFQTMSIKTRYLIFNIFMTLGGIFAAAKIILDFTDVVLPFDINLALIPAFAFFIIGFIFRLKVVKCPFCGCKLDDQKAPDVCPVCRRSAYDKFDPNETMEQTDE